jgi:hypothetical protein
MIPGYVREVEPEDGWVRLDAPAGFRVVVVDEFSREQIGRLWVRLHTPMRCRYTVGPRHTSCKRPAVLALNRGRLGRTALWGYCAEHLYGRRWEPSTGQLLTSIVVERNEQP